MIVDETLLPPTSFGRPAGDMVVVYDGDCPFCSNFVSLQRLRENVGTVSLVDARAHLPDVRAANAAGLDIDKGMLVFWQGRIYEGPDAVNLLARNGVTGAVVPAISRLFLSNRRMSGALYPFLRGGRNLALRLLGRSKMNG